MHTACCALSRARSGLRISPDSSATTYEISQQFSQRWRPTRRRFTSYTSRRTAGRNNTSPKPLGNLAKEPDADFISIVDAPPKIVSTRRSTSKLGIILLAIIPVTAFCLGTWQVQRLDWKSKLIAKFEDRLIKSPLPLPPHVDPDAIKDFDYRRVVARGKYRHDKEMLIGPRMHDGNDGFLVVTPLERRDQDEDGGDASTILVCRGWISREKKFQQDRDADSALPRGEVVVSGLLREPWKKNMFTPDNKPAEAKFYFPDVGQMAQVAGAEPVWIEETMAPSLLDSYNREARGIPIGRPAEVNLRNNHAQYIFTWYSLSAATSIMMWMVLRKKPSDLTRRVRTSKEW